MTSPSSGVSPIEVSTERPPWIAAADAPLPRWSTTRRSVRRVALEDRGGSRGDVAVRGPVEPVPTDAEPRRDVAVDRVGVGDRGDRRVEGGVEHGDVRDVGKGQPGGADSREACRVVQGSELGQPLDAGFDLVVDDRRCGELDAAVDDSVTDSVDRGTVEPARASATAASWSGASPPSWPIRSMLPRA